MNKDLYDVFRMQRDDAEKLVSDENSRIKKSNEFNDKASAALGESDKKLTENLEWLKEIGITLDEDLEEARKKADEESDLMIKEINKANQILDRNLISYDDLVEIAHSRGYVSTEIQNLLSEEEIRIADERFASIEVEFQNKTKLKKIDVVFLITAIALQVVRQYAITPFSDKSTADEGAKIMEDKYGKGGKLKGKYYYATEETIIGQKKVPFDIIT